MLLSPVLCYLCSLCCVILSSNEICLILWFTVACEKWKRTDNTSAENGLFYPVASLTDCMNLCLSKSSCVAIDKWSDTCSLHINVTDLLSNSMTVGVSQFVLDRACEAIAESMTPHETIPTTSVTTTGYIVTPVNLT